MEKFKEFIENWHKNNDLEESQLVYELFMKLWQESYNNQSFLEIASEFIEEIREKFDHEWRKKWWDPFQDACIAYLFEEMPIESEEVKEKIRDRFKPLPQGGAKNILLELANDTSRVNKSYSGEELRAFLEPFKEHIIAYQDFLKWLNRKYTNYKRTILLYAFQLFGAIQKFTITRHLFKNVDNDRGGNYLLSPSHAHYLINPKETIFILVRTSVGGGAWQEIKRELNKYQLKTNKVHLFTFDINLSSNLFREFEQENIQVVTPKSIKNKHYADNEDVITLEELLSLCKAKKHNFWKDYRLSPKEKREVQRLFRKKVSNFEDFELLKNWYQEQVEELKGYKSMSEIINAQ